MDAFDLMKRVGAEMVRGRIRYRPEGPSGSFWVTLAKLEGDSMVLTRDGSALIREFEQDLPKRRRTRKPALEGLISPPETTKATDPDDLLAGLDDG